jgi:8-amino-7-oxononanoate synthase
MGAVAPSSTFPFLQGVAYNQPVPIDVSSFTGDVHRRVMANASISHFVSASEIESDGAKMTVASSADVLGLSLDPRVREGATAALRKFGLDNSGSTQLIQRFEARLAGAFGAPAAMVISDEAALLSLMPTWNWMTHVRSRHWVRDALFISSPEEAEAALEQSPVEGLILEALHVHEGDLTNTPRFAEVCLRRRVALVVMDDGMGVLGPSGGGAVDHLSLRNQVDVHVLPLGRAIPGTGAVVLGSAGFVEALRGTLPAPPAMAIAASQTALDIVAGEPSRRNRLFDTTHKLLSGLQSLGCDTGPCVTPWIPVWVGDEALCAQWLEGLAHHHVFCRGLMWGPRSRLLLAPPATLSDSQLDQILEAFSRLSRKLQFPESRIPRTEGMPLARPGTYAMAAPAPLHWSTVDVPSRTRKDTDSPVAAAPPSSAENLSLKNRIFDAVETATWRATSVGGAQLRRGADAFRTLLDKKRG